MDEELKVILEDDEELFAVIDDSEEDFTVALESDDEELMTLLENDFSGMCQCDIEEDIPVIGVTVGNFNDGDIIEKHTPIGSILKKMLQKVIHPLYTSPTLSLSSSNASVFEIGTNYNVTVRPVFNQNDGGGITKTAWFFGNDEVETGTALSNHSFVLNNTSTIRYKVDYADGHIKKNNFNEYDSVGQIKAGSVSKDIKFTGVYPFYYGAISDKSIITTEGLTKVVTVKENKTLSYTGISVYSLLLYPDSYGLLKKIYDQNKFDVTDGFETGTILINDVQYRYYVAATAATVNGFAFTFNF